LLQNVRAINPTPVASRLAYNWSFHRLAAGSFCLMASSSSLEKGPLKVAMRPVAFCIQLMELITRAGGGAGAATASAEVERAALPVAAGIRAEVGAELGALAEKFLTGDSTSVTSTPGETAKVVLIDPMTVSARSKRRATGALASATPVTTISLSWDDSCWDDSCWDDDRLALTESDVAMIRRDGALSSTDAAATDPDTAAVSLRSEVSEDADGRFVSRVPGGVARTAIFGAFVLGAFG
jgi:hypothetical protein